MYQISNGLNTRWENSILEIFDITASHDSIKEKREDERRQDRSKGQDHDQIFHNNDNDNSSIYSILKDYKELNVAERGANMRIGPKSSHEDDIVLSDISNIGFSRQRGIKKTSFSGIIIEDKPYNINNDENKMQITKKQSHKLPSGPDIKLRSRQSSKEAPPKSPVSRFNLHNNSIELHSQAQPGAFQFYNSSLESHQEKNRQSPQINGINFEAEFSKLYPGKSQNRMAAARMADVSNKKLKTESTIHQSKLKQNEGHNRDEDQIQIDAYNSGSSKKNDKIDVYGRKQDTRKQSAHSSFLSRKVSRESVKHDIRSSKECKSISKEDLPFEFKNRNTIDERSSSKQYLFIRDKSKPRDSHNHMKSSKKMLQEYSQVEMEMPQDSSIVDLYVPKIMRKKRKDDGVLSKVDHRRDLSQSRASQHVSILEKQFKYAHIETYESGVSNGKGGYRKQQGEEGRKYTVK